MAFSQYFLALSQAPPALDIMMATIAPDPMPPASMPTKQRGPTKKPTNKRRENSIRAGRDHLPHRRLRGDSHALVAVGDDVHVRRDGAAPFDAMMMQSF